MLWLLLRVMPQVRMADVARTLARPFVATGVMIAALWLTERLVALAPAPMLAVKIVIGVVVYPATIVALWRLAGKPDGAEAYLARSARGAWEAWRNSKR
jgi:hypothetical protein